MIKKVRKKHTKGQVLKLLDPIVREWFDTSFKDLTPSQAVAIPLINQGKNALIASPTGSGKTLTAFLMIINELFKLSRTAELENKVYSVYISPLKALANDIERNLNSPLKEIYSIAERYKIKLPEIRVGVRSGDTSTAERQKMTKKAPHILITTPESLGLIISTKRFRLKLLDTQFIIVDEIHEICSSKRGVHLSLSLERLQNQILTEGLGREFIRIGLSATQAPIREIAKFLVGYNKSQKLRNINIIEAPANKKLDLRVICPVQDMNLIPYEIVNAKMYNLLIDLINKHRTTLVFTNTRSGTENVVYRLQEQGVEQIAAHHGSLSKETRLEVENKLKKGELAATICSTSLELGIDIGYIDLVCQIGSPKSIAKGLQRIGRAGHALHEISKGRIIVFDHDDLVECAVLVKNAYDGNIDRINILKNSLDVLAQCLVGMSLEKRWEIDECYSLVKQSYCYHNLPKKDFLSVLKFIGGKHAMEDRGVYGKLRYHLDTQTFGIRRGARLIYNLNIGTIPQEANYRAIQMDTGNALGSLSEKFVERLASHDVFVLGGKSYEFIKIRGMRVYVRDAHGKKPTVPSWTGEMLPRSFDLSCEIGKFRTEVAKRLARSTPDEVEEWLMKDYYLDSGSAKTIVNYFIEQIGIIKTVPSNNRVLIEGYIDGTGYKNIIFHYCFGRRVNDALSRAYGYALSKKLKCTVRISLTDDNFMLTLPKHVDIAGIESIIKDDILHENLIGALRNSELFKQRFRHCAVRSFMILRNYKGREISVRKQLRRSRHMLDLLHKLDNFPVVSESYNEIMYDAMDIKNAEEVLNKISNGEIQVSYSDYSKIPSPFAHNVVLIGISDIILMEDRSALLRELHQQVLAKVFSDIKISKPKFELQPVERYFKNKFSVVEDKFSLYSLLKQVGALRIFKEKGKNIYSYTDASRANIQDWARELISEGKLISVMQKNEIFWLPKEQIKYHLRLHSNDKNLTEIENAVFNWITDAGEAGRIVQLRSAEETQSSKERSSSTAELFPLQPRELMDTIKRLERRLLIRRLNEPRDGEEIQFANYPSTLSDGMDIQDLDYSSALDFLITQYLSCYAPATVPEIAYDLSLDEDLVSKTLTDLESAKQVVPGNYILGKDVPQYLLAHDLAALEQPPTEKSQVVDENQMLNYLFKKSFELVADINAYFEKFGVAYGKKEVFLRTKHFSQATWNKYLAKKKILQGRFLNGHVCYVPKADAPLYVTAYRKAELTDLELSVLDIIKRQRGITRQQIANKLDARKTDIKDIIEKLERNLYIIREPFNYDPEDVDDESNFDPNLTSGIANRYQFYEHSKPVQNSELVIIKKLLKSNSPLSTHNLQDYTGFSPNIINECLLSLQNSGEIVKFQAVGEYNTEMYIPADEFNSLLIENKVIETTDNVRLLSLFDNYSARLMNELRIKFGDDWQTLIIYSGHLVGSLNLWQRGDCIEIRNIIFDDGTLSQVFKLDVKFHEVGDVERFKLILLKKVLDELDKLLGYYKYHGLDIIKIKEIFNLEPKELTNEIKDVLDSAGYRVVQDFLVKGKLEPIAFNKRLIMRYILQNQHILPKTRFSNPLEAIRKMGGIRSNYEMRLRLDGKFYDIKEFRKNLNLVVGPMIPEYLMYCTKKDLLLYKAAKGRKTDFSMEYILDNMSGRFSISGKNLFNRLTLTKEQFNYARKRLYEGLFIIRDPINKYRKVKNVPHINKQYARKFIIRRIIRNFGIFSIDGLATFTKHEFSTKELRNLLTELENDGELIKGYFIENDDTLYWLHKDAIDKITKDRTRFNHRFIVSPQDQLAVYLAPEIKKRFGSGSCYIIFHGFEISGIFKIKQKNKKVWITEFKGDNDDWHTVERFFRENKLELVDEETEELYSDVDG